MKKANRLINEQSPYLLQHAYNPVDWYPWGTEAFEKAAREDKPVFLSIGYSTCHWCHVMEKESFEDEEVARLMNETFISVKVDREERPDIDGIYMTVCQMLTGGGGWPMTIIMTPEKLPFFAGTYFPKQDNYGRTGMLGLVPRLKDIWINRRADVLRTAKEITAAAANPFVNSEAGTLNTDIFINAYTYFSRKYDPVNGGFNSAPKFPMPHNIYFLLRYWKRSGDDKALEMAENTLIKMRLGGIYDHIGFGFHRYSTDAEWLVPHFEKMLYDQALLAAAYTEAYTATGKEFYKKTTEEIFEYVLRDMKDSAGGFYSAEDADSDGEEGKFYLWTTDELHSLLKDDAELFIKTFNAEDAGNWFDPVHSSNDASNILHLKKTLDDLSKEKTTSVDYDIKKFESLRQKLFNVREHRSHPYKDDKILLDWNALMISSLARAGQAFGNMRYTKAAEVCAEFIFSNMTSSDGRLLHRYRNGSAGISANADDYAFFIAALLDLYEASFKPLYLKKAISLNDDFIDHFWDEKDKGFFFTADDSEELITRRKEIYDGAVPSGNSAAILNLLRLSRFTGIIYYEEKAAEILNAFAGLIKSSPAAYSLTLTAVDFYTGPSFEIIITGSSEKVNSSGVLSYLRTRFIPNKVIMFKDKDNEAELGIIAPFTQNYPAGDDVKVYLCRNFSCSLPVSNPEELENLLNSYR